VRAGPVRSAAPRSLLLCPHLRYSESSAGSGRRGPVTGAGVTWTPHWHGQLELDGNWCAAGASRSLRVYWRTAAALKMDHPESGRQVRTSIRVCLMSAPRQSRRRVTVCMGRVRRDYSEPAGPTRNAKPFSYLIQTSKCRTMQCQSKMSHLDDSISFPQLPQYPVVCLSESFSRHCDDHMHDMSAHRAEYTKKLSHERLARILAYQTTDEDQLVAAQARMHYYSWHRRQILRDISWSSWIYYHTDLGGNHVGVLRFVWDRIRWYAAFS
jgi:hypothetical protein